MYDQVISKIMSSSLGVSKMLTRKKQSNMTDSYVSSLHKEWDDTLCPICMEHPHNAVLLLCSSHSNSCRPFICDTSNRHSNCLDRYKNLKKEMNLQCPLCRTDVKGWKFIEAARKYLNMKTRSCSMETCRFAGNYGELRKHARSLHPHVFPTEVNPLREKAWKEFEQQNEINDINSAIQSATPGAVIIGDFVIEDEDYDVISNESWTNSSTGELDLIVENLSDFNLNEVPNVIDDDSPDRRVRRRLTRTRSRVDLS